ncbi:MAG: hypothetical protein CL565_01540 [Alphaproteobacteria bacterium]|nr:hypothetical protein [Alphaproteobacteria bacterium]
MRKRFVSRLNSDHKFNGLLMKALINGMEKMPELKKADRARLVRTVSKQKNITEYEAIRLLSNGIKGVGIITTPEAGFFHVIDLQKDNPATKVWKCAESGQLYTSEIKRDSYFDKEVTISTLLKDDNISFAHLQWAGYDEKESLRRVSFAVPLSDILSFAERLKVASDTFHSVISNQNQFSKRPEGKNKNFSTSLHA